jgi:REP element-mobilizing transposase RayT
MPHPWNDWYHVVTHVYGSWLRGDPRGWRVRNHKLHVSADYKHPSKPKEFASLHARSKSLMKRPPVHIQTNLRQTVTRALVDKLESDGIQILAISVDGAHVHILAKFPDRKPRHWLGRAKKHTSHLLRQESLRTDQGGLWAKCSRAQPIRDRAHQINTYHYILKHAQQGAHTWTFRNKPKANG